MRAILITCFAVLVSGCGSQNSAGPKPVPWTGDSGLAPPSLTQPDSAPPATSLAPDAASKSETAPAPSAAAAAAPAPVVAPTQDIPPAKPEELGEMSSSTGGATTITRPCELSNCGVVLSISGHKLWEIEVKMHDGTVRVFQQDFQPPFRIGDSVFVDGNSVFLWN
jgi:hypothetical protein